LPLSDKLGKDDGWKRFSETELHFEFKGKFLCGVKPENDTPADNVREHQCQTCFERVRNLYNSNKIEDAYRDL